MPEGLTMEEFLADHINCILIVNTNTDQAICFHHSKAGKEPLTYERQVVMGDGSKRIFLKPGVV